MQTRIQQNLASYYHQRITQLQTLKLAEILATDGRAFWSPLSSSAPDLVARLIENRLVLFESQWQVRIQDADICLAVIQMRDQAEEFFDYETELAHAHNRLTREFIIQFCDENGSIDWAKLLHFNSRNN